MQLFPRHRDRHRLAGASIALGIHLLLGLFLLSALRGGSAIPTRQSPPVTVFALAPPPVQPQLRVIARRQPMHRRAPSPSPRAAAPSIGAPAPPAPIPALDLPSLTGPVMVEAGGQAGGGAGGSGRGGDGNGDGTPPRRIAGRITDRDYPRALSEAGVAGTVGVRYRVDLDGSVTDCRVTRSSGSTTLDAHTCALIVGRFHFRAARDAAGRAVAAIIVEQHAWIIPAAVPPQE